MALCVCCQWPLTEFDRRIVADGWQGRMNGYCHDCALRRCDAYPSACKEKVR